MTTTNQTETVLAILARYGVKADITTRELAGRQWVCVYMTGGISESFGRYVDLRYSSHSGWSAGTTGTSELGVAALTRYAREALEVQACLLELRAAGETVAE